MITICVAESEEDVLAIKALQCDNLRSNVSIEKQKSDGFVINEYDVEFLFQICRTAPNIIAKDSTSKLIGYALTVLPENASNSPGLNELVSLINDTEFKGKPTKTLKYYIMGQVCIADGFRGKNVFDRMYDKHRELFGNSYDLLITDVAEKNVRSFRAHLRVGFEVLHTYKGHSTNETWHIIAWDWRN
ncbi:unnamed protein product [Adineta ricciae]|uniref:GNAT family N-acetyltransferase n=1 Tax=Adineta ricciae TaxID=249248 RepID=A0A813Y6L7_ADIRI|nr:unnamed protein product [Adineta ricciae]